MKTPDQFRHPHPLFGMGGGNSGYFVIPLETGFEAHCLSSDGLGWEHVSAHVRWKTTGEERTPEWDDMCKIKSLFWNDDECVIQYHPPKSEYVNNHPHVLHLWKPIGQSFPMPDSLLVGIKPTKG